MTFSSLKAASQTDASEASLQEVTANFQKFKIVKEKEISELKYGLELPVF